MVEQNGTFLGIIEPDVESNHSINGATTTAVYLFITLILCSIQGLRNVTDQNQGVILRLIWLVISVASFIASAVCITESINGKVALSEVDGRQL